MTLRTVLGLPTVLCLALASAPLLAHGQPGTMPPGTMPPGTMSPGTMSPGTMPPGTMPPGTMPPGNAQNGGTQNGQDGNAQTSIEKAIQKYKAALRKVGPESHAGRVDAVAGLLAINDSRAHAVLHDYAVPGKDPEGVRQLLLSKLPEKLRNPHDAVFGRGDKRDLIRSLYITPLVQHFGDDPEAAAQPDAARLRELARRSLIAMGTGELRKSLGELMKAQSVVVRRQVLRAAGQCQDTGLARLIGAHLDVKELGPTARRALYDLTYTDFNDAATFQEWYAENGQKTYLDLAEGAARRARKDKEASVDAVNTRHIATVVQFIDVLATSTRKEKWTLIRGQVFPTPSARVSPKVATAFTRACLVRLRAVLAEAAPVQSGPDAAERLVFFGELVQRLADKSSPVDYALLLEVSSYLCAPSETAQRTAQQKRLIEGLHSDSAEIKLGALRGLRRFFSPSNRREVLAVATAARKKANVAALAVAVETLKSSGWSAPAAGDPHSKEWVAEMQAILTDERLTDELRTEVISVLCLTDDKGRKLDEAFDLLLQEVARGSASVDLRKSVMLRLPGFIPTGNGSGDAAAEKYLQRLVDLQAETVAVDIRRAAASMLVVPANVSKEKRKVLGNKLVLAIGDRLLKEADERVFEQLVRVLALQAEVDELLVAVVNTRLRQALAALGSKDGTKNLAKHVVDGLRVVAVKKGRTTAEWTATCESLLKQRDRQTIRQILNFHLRDLKARQLANQKKEVQYKVWKLVIETAGLAPDNLLWSDRGNRGEAEMVNEAFKVLLAEGEYARSAKTLDTARNRLTCLRCLHAVGGDAALLEKRASTWLKPGDKVLVGHDRNEARLLLARSHLAQGKTTEAWMASGIQAVVGTLLEERLKLQVEIAETMLQQKPRKTKEAEAVFRDVVAKTKKDAPDYWPRLRRHIEVRYELDRKKAAALLAELNAWVLATPNLKPEFRKQVDTLKAELQAGAKPPK